MPLKRVVHASVVFAAAILVHGAVRAQGTPPPDPPADEPAEEGFEVPEALKPWAEAAYTLRYFVRVDGPPLAGTINLQNTPHVATVYLPLRTFEIQAAAEDGEDEPSARVETVLVLDEKGEVQPVLARQVKGGSEVELAFPTRSGQRRYAIYSGAPEGQAPRASPTTFRTHALMVRRLVRTVGGESMPKPDAPLTAASFKALGEQGGRGEPAACLTVDDTEPPKEHLKRSGPRYAALYEGFLRAPVDGTYGFALETPGTGMLVIDGYEVCLAGQPDARREPFTVRGELELRAGVHRVVVYHIQAGAEPGIRLCWRPPFEKDFGIVPPQAFPRGLPAVVGRVENVAGHALPFVHIERVAQFRGGRHRGPKLEQEWMLYHARGLGAGAARVAVSAAGAEPAEWPLAGGCVWLPAGNEARFELRAEDGAAIPDGARTVRFPLANDGGRNVIDLTGALSLKAAPAFLHPDETGQLHLETQLEPVPVILDKERVEEGPPLPSPRPYGQYRVTWRLVDAAGHAEVLSEAEATPLGAGRRKVRVPLPAERLEAAAQDGLTRLEARLSVGGMPVESVTLRLLHSRQTWPADLVSTLDGLAIPAVQANKPAERVLVLVPREREADYRRFRPPLIGGRPGAGDGAALFLGDPLVEAPAETKADASLGLASRLAKASPDRTWQFHLLPGPHRGLFVYRLLAGAESWLRANGGKASALVVVSIGGGDAARQTALHDFERGLDVLVDRLRRAGAERILMLGVMPEPGRAAQAEPYRQRWADIVRLHHLESFDLYERWTADGDWIKRFALDPQGGSPVYGATPHVTALDELAAELSGKVK